MPGQVRPNMKLAKIVYKIQKTDKDQQQRNEPEPSDRRRKEWQATYLRTSP